MLDWLFGPKTETVSKADHDAEIAKFAKAAEADRATIDALDKSARRFRQERDAARAELEPLKAARERANANLAAANARRKAEAQPALN
jgi:predicted  nucleic acid-binding Zn-ribbon protein